MARKSMSQTEQQEDKVAENASNKRKWEGNHNGSSSQQNKGHKVPRAHATRPTDKKAYDGSQPLKLNNNNQAQQQPPKKQCVAIADTAGPGEKKEYAGTLLSRTTTNNQRNLTCYECGNQRHYMSDCLERKNQNHENQTGGTGARGVVHALGSRRKPNQTLTTMKMRIRSLKEKVVSLCLINPKLELS
ncbi:reverse transcriptase domain-containing protein [Tanacetum coccineum]